MKLLPQATFHKSEILNQNSRMLRQSEVEVAGGTGPEENDPPSPLGKKAGGMFNRWIGGRVCVLHIKQASRYHFGYLHPKI
jgi:hypothetical protein